MDNNQKKGIGSFKLNNTILLMLFLLFLIFYLLFVVFGDFIHRPNVNLNFTDITPWLQGFARENDGFELYVMTLSFPIFLFISYLITIYSNYNFTSLKSRWISIIYFSLLSGTIIINLVLKEALTVNMLIVFASVFLIELITVYFTKFIFPYYARLIFYFMLLLLFTTLGLLINNHPSLFDYSFYLGPALKLLNGEKLGTFYIQYNLLGTFLFALMQKCHLLIDEMWFFLIIIFSFWILLYLKIARLLFNNREIIGLFTIALLIVRFISIWGGPVTNPQVSSIRLDLWVPLVILVLYFGFQSIITASAFSIIYLLDDVFGFMYLGLYIMILFYYFFRRFHFSWRIEFRIKHILLIGFPLISIGIHFFIFKSIGSTAGKIYSNFHFGFLPISRYSSFWLLAWISPICIYFLSKDKKNRIFYLFIFGLACIQLTYFFGRSHEHNLRNISGIFVFIIFSTIDLIYSLSLRKKGILWVIIIFIGFISLNFNSTIVENYNLAINRTKQGKLLGPNQIEQSIDLQGEYLKSIGANKIFVISPFDSYINYRLGFSQNGYYSPFYANFSTSQTIFLLKQSLDQGLRLILFPDCFQFSADYLNQSSIMRSGRERFKLEALNENLFEMKLVHY
jgi:hypothetical protein